MIGLIFFVYAIALLITGSPTVWPERKVYSGKAVLPSSGWLRLAGGLYIACFLLPSLGAFDYILIIASIIFYFVGLWRALSPRVM